MQLHIAAYGGVAPLAGPARYAWAGDRRTSYGLPLFWICCSSYAAAPSVGFPPVTGRGERHRRATDERPLS